MKKTIAEEISDYLLTGMHHSTREGQKAIGLIIEKRIKNKDKEVRCDSFDRLQRVIAGALRDTIRHHGRITNKDIGSAAKRAASQLVTTYGKDIING